MINHVTGNRTKRRTQFLENTCQRTERITIEFSDLGKIETVKINGKEFNNWETIAKNDGLSILSFESWFFKASSANVFVGVIIHWTDLKYAA